VALGVFLVLLLVPASVWASGARRHSISFRLVRADARVTLRFYQQSEDGNSINHGRVVTHVKGKPPGHGRLGADGGKITFPVVGKVLEHVRLERKLVNQQTTCEQTRKVAAKGGVTFTPVGSKIRVRWKFPQSRVSFCPGPETSKALTSKMRKSYSASHFKHSLVTIKLVGKSTEQDGQLLQATYKWRATLTLARVS
jgi:hypothetical protein